MEIVNKTILSFQINHNLFAVDALQVDHILEVPAVITKVPNTPSFMKGIINLHGTIIPVVDIKTMMGEEDIIVNNEDRAIVVINPSEAQGSKFGIIVDMVKEVLEINDKNLTETYFDGSKGMIGSYEGTLIQNDTVIHVVDIMHLVEIIEK